MNLNGPQNCDNSESRRTLTLCSEETGYTIWSLTSIGWSPSDQMYSWTVISEVNASPRTLLCKCRYSVDVRAELLSLDIHLVVCLNRHGAPESPQWCGRKILLVWVGEDQVWLGPCGQVVLADADWDDGWAIVEMVYWYQIGVGHWP